MADTEFPDTDLRRAGIRFRGIQDARRRWVGWPADTRRQFTGWAADARGRSSRDMSGELEALMQQHPYGSDQDLDHGITVEPGDEPTSQLGPNAVHQEEGAGQSGQDDDLAAVLTGNGPSVVEHAKAHPDQVAALIDAETTGAGRKTVLTELRKLAGGE